LEIFGKEERRLLNGLVRSIFEGYKAGKGTQSNYRNLQYEQLLHTSGYLNQLTREADEEQLRDIRDYLLRFQHDHDIFDTDAYADVYLDVLDRKRSFNRKREQLGKLRAKREGLRKELRK
jgi:hypothetical protein